MQHLTDESIADIVYRSRLASGSDGAHLNQCRACRERLAKATMQAAMIQPGSRDSPAVVGLVPLGWPRAILMPTGKGELGSGHLTRKQVSDLHAAAFEGAEMPATTFIANLWHLKSCDLCNARFVSHHQELTPSLGSLSRALAMFSRGLPPRPVGVVSIREWMRRLSVDFTAAADAPPHSTFPGPAFDRAGTSGADPKAASRFLPGLSDVLMKIVTSPWRALRALLRRAWESTTLARRLQRRPAAASGKDAVAKPVRVEVGSHLLVLTAFRAEGHLGLRVQVLVREDDLPAPGVSLSIIDGQGTSVKTVDTDAAGVATLDLSPLPKGLRIDLGVGQVPGMLYFEHEDKK